MSPLIDDKLQYSSEKIKQTTGPQHPTLLQSHKRKRSQAQKTEQHNKIDIQQEKKPGTFQRNSETSRKH